MAKVLILSADNKPFEVWRHSSAFLLRHSAELSPAGPHRLTGSPDEADLILFAEMGTIGKFQELVRAHPLYRRYAKKCFIFELSDFCFPVVPGLYASLTKEHARIGGVRTGFYLCLIENAFITHRPCTGNEPYLAAFVGSQSAHPVREQIFHIQREDFFLKDTSGYSAKMTYHGDPAERAHFWSEYADSIANARFSLCPRGAGAGSIRLFESMKMGRACVILADDWQPNTGVDWAAFSITVAERDAHKLPEILDRYADRAVEMGARARQAWEENFSEQVRFTRVVDQCLQIQAEGRAGQSARQMRLLRYVAAHPRWWLSSKRQLYRDTGRIFW